MKRNFNAGFTAINGQPLVEMVDSKPVQITLSAIALQALQGVFDDEKNLPAADKISRFTLATRIHQTPICDVVSEEVALLKLLINKAYPAPLIVAQAWAMLDADYVEAS